MNEKTKALWNKAASAGGDTWEAQTAFIEQLVKLTALECIDKIETYRIPVGNSSAGELACEWTYDALKSIRDDIRETFGLPDA